MRKPTARQLRRLYNISARDALAHGERPIPYARFVKLVRLQLKLARTDLGGNIVL